VNEKEKQKFSDFLQANGHDPDATIDEFEATDSPSTAGNFLSYLQQKGFVNSRDMMKLQAGAEIDVSGIASTNLLIESMRYDPIEVLGEGAMGEITLARDRDLRRKVAIKSLKPELMSSPVAKRFITEAQVTAQLDHPNIIPVYSLEIDPDGGISYAMKRIEGRTLQDFIAATSESCAKHDGRTVAPEYALANGLEIMLRVCEAIAYAHQRGIIHRDLKPANIMIGKFGEIYVVDWGIARPIASSDQNEDDPVEMVAYGADWTEATQHGKVIGTPRYMSPEQARGASGKLDGRSDLFALGLILFELVALKPALTGSSIKEVLDRVREADLAPLTPRYPNMVIPKDLQTIIRKATAAEPENRYASVRKFAEDIRHFLRGEELMASPDTCLQKFLRTAARQRMKSLLVVLALLSIFGIGTSWSLFARQRTIEQARVHAARRTEFLTHVTSRGLRIDRQLYRLTMLTDALATSISRRLECKPSQGELPHLYLNYQEGGQNYDALFWSPAYRQRISLLQAVYKLPPGQSNATESSGLDSLHAIVAVLREPLLESSRQYTASSPEDIQAEIMLQGAPVRWVYFGLTNGLYCAYPASGDYPADFDPRRRPWYSNSSKNTSSWITPYEDISDHEMVLTCTAPILGQHEEFGGVAAIDLILDKLVQNLLPNNEPLGTGAEAFLLDKTGHIIANSTGATGKLQMHSYSSKDKYLFPYTNVLPFPAVSDTGQVEIEDNGQTQIISWQKISAIGWYYVECQLDHSTMATPATPCLPASSSTF